MQLWLPVRNLHTLWQESQTLINKMSRILWRNWTSTQYYCGLVHYKRSMTNTVNIGDWQTSCTNTLLTSSQSFLRTSDCNIHKGEDIYHSLRHYKHRHTAYDINAVNNGWLADTPSLLTACTRAAWVRSPALFVYDFPQCSQTCGRSPVCVRLWMR